MQADLKTKIKETLKTWDSESNQPESNMKAKQTKKTKSVSEIVKAYVNKHGVVTLKELRDAYPSVPPNQFSTSLWKLSKAGVIKRLSDGQYVVLGERDKKEASKEKQIEYRHAVETGMLLGEQSKELTKLKADRVAYETKIEDLERKLQQALGVVDFLDYKLEQMYAEWYGEEGN